MKKILALLIICFLCLPMFSILAPKAVALSDPMTKEWEKTCGGTADDSASSVVQTSDGGYIVAGFTSSFGTGSDFWIVKVDLNGNEQWNKTFGSATRIGEDVLVIQTSDGGYAILGYTHVGYANWDMWLFKTDANGNEVWNKKYGGAREEFGCSVVQTVDGGYALAGFTYSFSTGWACDFWLVKTDSAGNEQWAKTYDHGMYDDCMAMIQTADGGYALAGQTGDSSIESKDAWLVKTDSSGNQQWAKTYGGSNYDYFKSLLQVPDGGYGLAGATASFGTGNRDFWLVRTDSEGNQQWAQTYGGANWDAAYSVVHTTDEGYLVAGTTESFGAGGKDGWVVKADSSGNMQLSSTYGGTGEDMLASLRQTSDGGFVLAGTTNSYGVGNYDFWLIKLGPSEISAAVDIDPDTLNLRSCGNWITCYIEFPEGYNVADIDVSSIRLNDTIPVDPTAPTAIGDYDSDGIPDLMVKFERAAVISYILDNVDIEERFRTVTLTITGYLNDGTPFQGSDIIKIIMPMLGHWRFLEFC